MSNLFFTRYVFRVDMVRFARMMAPSTREQPMNTTAELIEYATGGCFLNEPTAFPAPLYSQVR